MSKEQMPVDADIEPVTQADLESLAGKLEEWGASLPSQERAVLALLLSQAREQAEVEGFMSNYLGISSFSQLAVTRLRPFITQGIGASGFDSVAADKGWLNIGWQKDGQMPVANPIIRT